MNTTPAVTLPAQDVLADFGHLRLDTTDLDPTAAAARILAWWEPIGAPARARRTIAGGV